MARLVPRDGFVKETNVKSQSGIRRCQAGKDGMYNVSNASDIKALKKEGFTEASLSTYTTGDSDRGYTCTECGFGSWFKLCSRCGHDQADPKTDGD